LTDDRAFGADDVAGHLSAGQELRKLRFLMTDNSIRGLMHEAALQADEDPDRLSFVHAVHVVQRRLPRYVAIPPSAEKSLS
jgi:hypothetical protein